MTKRPKIVSDPGSKKIPRISSENSPNSYFGKSPVWRISTVDHEGAWGWDNLEIENFRKILERLKKFETMLWGEIIGKDNHPIAVKNISKDAKKRLAEINLNDIDELFSLRLTGQERIWGILDNGVLKLLWWDPEHTVYPVELKHS